LFEQLIREDEHRGGTLLTAKTAQKLQQQVEPEETTDFSSLQRQLPLRRESSTMRHLQEPDTDPPGPSTSNRSPCFQSHPKSLEVSFQAKPASFELVVSPRIIAPLPVICEEQLPHALFKEEDTIATIIQEESKAEFDSFYCGKSYENIAKSFTQPKCPDLTLNL